MAVNSLSGIIAYSGSKEMNPYVSTRFSLDVENEEAEAGPGTVKPVSRD